MKRLVLIVLLLIVGVTLFAQREDWEKRNPLIDATVMIGNLQAGGMGTGFFVTPDGYLITAAHVVTSYGKTIVIRPDPPYFHVARIVYTDDLNDWAILKVDEVQKPFPYLQPGNLEKIEIGDEIRYCGHPLGLSWMYLKGSLAGVKYDGNGRSYLFGDVTNAPGSSGSAICNSENEVIGIVQQGITGVGSIGIALEDFVEIAKRVIEEDLRLFEKRRWLEDRSQRFQIEWEFLLKRIEKGY